MAQPTPYERQYNFSNYQSVNPSDPLPGAQVDNELNAAKASLDETQANLALIQRDDGQLKNNSVGFDQLKEEVEIGVNPPSAWVTLTNYAVADTVTQEAGFYRCAVAHISGTFATDLAAGKWTLIVDFSDAISSSAIEDALHNADSKAEPVDGDEFLGNDSADTYTIRRFNWANIKATMFAAIGTLLNSATGKTTPVDADMFAIGDSAASNATKKLTFVNLATTLFTGLGAKISAATGKTTPVDADSVLLSDSADSNSSKSLTWANLLATMFTAFGGLVNGATGKTTPVDADMLVLADSAASNATKKLTWSNLKATLKTYLDTLYAPVGTGTARNRVVNPAMQISQENGSAAGTTTGYYGADQFATYFVTSEGTITTQRVQSVTPNGSKDRYRVTITAADASLAAGEYLTVTQNIEGNEVADLQWGAAAAVDVVVRFGFKGPEGTYAVALHNSATDRSYVALFSISSGEANTDTEQEIAIPGDTTGTWLTDTGIGITLDIVLACGSTFQGTTGWQAGNILGTSGVTNGMATINDVFEIFDVGLYADPQSTGVAPTWETPSNHSELQRCQRYFLGSHFATLRGWAGAASSTLVSPCYFPVEMRGAPTITAGTVTATGNVASEEYEVITSKGFRFRVTSTASGDTFVLERVLTANVRL